MTRQKRPAKTTTDHPLVGMWLHTWWPNGKLDRQGQVLGVDRQSVIVQVYDFVLGERSKVEVLPKSFVYSGACTLYPTNRQMREAYEQFMRREFPDFRDHDLHDDRDTLPPTGAPIKH